MKIRSVVLIFVCSLIFVLPSFSQNLEDRFHSGNEWMKKGNNEAALAEYQAVEEVGLASFELYKNMALAHANLKQDAYAILYFEKCLKLQPFDKLVQNDLKIIKQRNPDLSEGLPSFFLIEMINKTAQLFSPMTWTIISFLFLACILGMVIYYFPEYSFDRTKKITAVLFFIFFIASTSLAIIRNNQVYHSQQYIVTGNNVDLMIGPDANSPEKLSLPAGSKVTKKDEIGDWIQIQTNEGDLGWILARQSRLI